jgi:outer membrane protein assembly factor BamB
VKRVLLPSIGILVLGLTTLRADDWPMFGGRPDRNPVSADKGLPGIFGKENVRWVVALGDQTNGTPSVGGGRVFIGTNNGAPRDTKIAGDRGVLMCFSAADGKFLWQTVHEKLPGKEAEDWPSAGIASTPCVAGEQVTYVSNRGELVCCSVQDGKILWLLDMKKDLGAQPYEASASSPLVVGDLVFVNTGNSPDGKTHKVKNPAAPSFLAVNRQTGKVVWQDSSPGDKIVHGQWGSAAYGVVEGQPQVAFSGGDGWVYSFEPATGKLIWKFNCKAHEKAAAPGAEPTEVNLPATPVFSGHRVLIAVGVDVDTTGEGCLRAIDARQKGDVTKSAELWRFEGKEFGLTISNVAVHEGLVYAVELDGRVDCIDLETGKRLWRHDLLAQSWSTPLVVDGKVYVRTGDTEIVVFQAARTLKVLGVNNQGNPFKLSHGSVIAAGGVLYFAGQTQLFAVAAGK